MNFRMDFMMKFNIKLSLNIIQYHYKIKELNQYYNKKELKNKMNR